MTTQPQPDPTQHLIDYEYISQFSPDVIGIIITVDGVATDVDGNTMLVTMTDQNSNVIFNQVAAAHTGTGQYELTLTSTYTANPGYYTFSWAFYINTIAQTEYTYAQVGHSNPAYDALPSNMKAVVEQCWIRFADQFDSPQGGPYLQTLFQTNFSRGRLAQLLQLALGTLNSAAQPFQTYTLTNFPVSKWGALLERALYCETLEHLMRSYLEMPTVQGLTVSRTDRTTYLNAYKDMLMLAKQDLRREMDVFKIAAMNLGSARVLISGGAYGNYAPTRTPMSAAARGHIWQRGF